MSAFSFGEQACFKLGIYSYCLFEMFDGVVGISLPSLGKEVENVILWRLDCDFELWLLLPSLHLHGSGMITDIFGIDYICIRSSLHF